MNQAHKAFLPLILARLLLCLLYVDFANR